MSTLALVCARVQGAGMLNTSIFDKYGYKQHFVFFWTALVKKKGIG
jgi:hypothetical protein